MELILLSSRFNIQKSYVLTTGSVTLLALDAGGIVELILITSRFNIQKFYVLTTECVYTSCTVLKTNNYYFPKHQ